jgi:hypothetical protein
VHGKLSSVSVPLNIYFESASNSPCAKKTNWTVGSYSIYLDSKEIPNRDYALKQHL